MVIFLVFGPISVMDRMGVERLFGVCAAYFLAYQAERIKRVASVFESEGGKNA